MGVLSVSATFMWEHPSVPSRVQTLHLTADRGHAAPGGSYPARMPVQQSLIACTHTEYGQSQCCRQECCTFRSRRYSVAAAWLHLWRRMVAAGNKSWGPWTCSSVLKSADLHFSGLR